MPLELQKLPALAGPEAGALQQPGDNAAKRLTEVLAPRCTRQLRQGLGN